MLSNVRLVARTNVIEEVREKKEERWRLGLLPLKDGYRYYQEPHWAILKQGLLLLGIDVLTRNTLLS